MFEISPDLPLASDVGNAMDFFFINNSKTAAAYNL